MSHIPTPVVLPMCVESLALLLMMDVDFLTLISSLCCLLYVSGQRSLFTLAALQTNARAIESESCYRAFSRIQNEGMHTRRRYRQSTEGGGVKQGPRKRMGWGMDIYTRV